MQKRLFRTVDYRKLLLVNAIPHNILKPYEKDHNV